jgi:hypothetical protein
MRAASRIASEEQVRTGSGGLRANGTVRTGFHAVRGLGIASR